MDKQTRQLRKESALKQMELLQTLVNAIDDADNLHEQLMNTNNLLSQYSKDLQVAQEKISFLESENKKLKAENFEQDLPVPVEMKTEK